MTLTWDRLNRLEGEFGDSYYLFHADHFRRNYQDFLDAFRSLYPNTHIAYSYKTNYLPILCRSVNAWGGYAEVVSRMEYDLACRMGVPADRIVFNGPYKHPEDLVHALRKGSIVNLDSSYELPAVARAALESSRPIVVGLRCNFHVEAAGPSRFGFDVEGEAFRCAVRQLHSLGNCHFAGLHCHILSLQRDEKTYAHMAKRMISLASEVFPSHLPQFIDLGGGFLSRMPTDLRKQFPFRIPSFQDYALAVATCFKEAFPGKDQPKLILEPGIALTADILQFVARVMDVKILPHRRVALVSGSVYDVKPTKSRRNLPITVIHKSSEASNDASMSEVDIVGYTCMEDDCLFSGYSGPIAPGDYVVLGNVGAYTLVLKPPFVRPSAPVLACSENSDHVEILKQQETLAHVFATHVLDP